MIDQAVRMGQVACMFVDCPPGTTCREIRGQGVCIPYDMAPRMGPEYRMAPTVTNDIIFPRVPGMFGGQMQQMMPLLLLGGGVILLFAWMNTPGVGRGT